MCDNDTNPRPTDCSKCIYRALELACDIGYDCGGPWYDSSCTHPKIGSRKLTYYIEEHEPEPTPCWCPFKEKDDTTKAHKTITDIMKIWAKKESTIKWEDIEVGQIYHMPPGGRENRGEWFIIEKSGYFLSARVLSNFEMNSKAPTRTMWKNSDDAWKMFVKPKMPDVTDLTEKCKKEFLKKRSYYPSV